MSSSDNSGFAGAGARAVWGLGDGAAGNPLVKNILLSGKVGYSRVIRIVASKCQTKI